MEYRDAELSQYVLRVERMNSDRPFRFARSGNVKRGRRTGYAKSGISRRLKMASPLPVIRQI
jgi:hypothetical protein|tara:strand:- start:5113 stop:5298 length:186 start_codon:yes stop_codon:yes gene_type:complete